MIHTIEEIYSTANFRQKDALNALVFSQALKHPGISRKEITNRFNLRPSSVSQACNELIDRNILRQEISSDLNQRGRPEVSLYAVTDHWVAACIFMESLDFRAAFTDISSKITPLELPVNNPGSAGFQDRFESVLHYVMSSRPAGKSFIGISLSLPGYGRRQDDTWITSTRFGEIHQVESHRLGPTSDIKLRWIRSVDARAQALLLTHPDYRQGKTVLFHWGYGICVSVAIEGTLINDGFSKFGELGHTIVNGQNGLECRCGSRGCLETEASIWTLLPKLRKRFKDLPENEREFSAFLSNRFIEEIPEIERAIDYINIGLVNVSKLFAPDRILLYGPFTDNNQIYKLLEQKYYKNEPRYEFSCIELARIRHTPADEVVGATYSLFLDSLRTDLRAGN